jgi:hypothetical protein
VWYPRRDNEGEELRLRSAKEDIQDGELERNIRNLYQRTGTI